MKTNDQKIQIACDKCSVGIMDIENPHLWVTCQCPCHDEGSISRAVPEVSFSPGRTPSPNELVQRFGTCLNCKFFCFDYDRDGIDISCQKNVWWISQNDDIDKFRAKMKTAESCKFFEGVKNG